MSIDVSIVPVFNVVSLMNFSFVILIIIALLYYEKIYTLRFDFWQETQRVLKALFLAYMLVMAILTFTKTSLDYSRLFMVLYFAFAIVLIPILKRYLKKIIFSFKFFKQRILLIGNEDQIKILKEEFDQNWYLGLYYCNKKYDSVIVASKGIDINKVNKMVSNYLDNHRDVFIVPNLTDINFIHSNIMEYTNIRYNTIHIENKLLVQQNIIIKSLFDKIVTFSILPIFIIIHAIISLAIRLDSKGSIVFQQYRLGKDDNDFLCYKYRTMYEESDEILNEYLKYNPDEIENYEKYHKYKNDPRITKIGKILRVTSLDELPQFLNIIKGEMSLVGPRPYMVGESDKLGENQHKILKVKPGITGLWQVSGRNNLTFKERNDLEIWYIKNWSLWADFVILMKTIKVVFGKIGSR